MGGEYYNRSTRKDYLGKPNPFRLYLGPEDKLISFLLSVHTAKASSGTQAGMSSIRRPVFLNLYDSHLEGMSSPPS